MEQTADMLVKIMNVNDITKLWGTRKYHTRNCPCSGDLPILDLVWFPVHKSDSFVCFVTSLQQRGHLEMAPPFTVPCEGREAL